MFRHLLSLAGLALSLLSTSALAQQRLPALGLQRLQFDSSSLVAGSELRLAATVTSRGT